MVSNKLFVRVYDDKVKMTDEDGGLFVSYWVKDAGLTDEHQYPCVMVDLLLEIKHYQALGFDVVVVDERGRNA